MALGDWYAKTYDRQQLEATLEEGGDAVEHEDLLSTHRLLMAV